MRLRSTVHFGVLLLAAWAVRAAGLTISAGPITHTLTGYKVLREIPASWTIPEFKALAKPEPAPAGHVWYVMRGQLTNGASAERMATGATYRIRDAQGKDYKLEVGKVLYTPAAIEVLGLTVAPGQTKEWMAFFAIPPDAKGLVLHADDLTLGRTNVAQVRIPDPAQGLAVTSAPASTTPPAASSAPATRTTSQPAGAGAIPQMTAADFFRDFNAEQGAETLMNKYKNGLSVSGPVLLTLKEMDGSHHVWLDATGGNYVSLSFNDKGAAVVAKGIKKGDSVQARCDVGGGIGKYIMVNHCELK